MKRKFKEVTAYTKAAGQVLDRFGAVYMPEQDVYRYSIMTKAGILLASIGDDCCICTKFTNVDAALDLGLGERLNVHSGKWNWMGGNCHQGDMLDLANFQQALRKIV